MPFLYTAVILLVAAVIAVPLAKRWGFGSVLGYLAAGLLIGPAGLSLVSDVERIASVSELGVFMLLFLIGLELRPARLWIMRRSVFGLGAAQIFCCTAALFLVAQWAGLSWQVALVAAFALSMSSTAIVLPMLAERELLTTHAGRDAFAVLLFQDIAVIPAVALLPLLNGETAGTAQDALLAVARGVGALAIVMIGGRFFIRPIFRLVDSAKTPEIFTATALMIVAGTAVIVSAAGLSMSLGAFMAGVLLSDSEYRHEVRANIEPFEGLLLGVFFISVGMEANLALLLREPVVIALAVAAVLGLKALVCFALARIAGQEPRDAMRFAVALPQAGEFCFVLFSAAVAASVISGEQSERAILVITCSMILSPVLFALHERFVVPLLSKTDIPLYDPINVQNDVIICGFGRVGQIVGRVLRLKGMAFTALDKSAEQIELVRRFGAQAFYGDSSRLDLLRAAGAEQAKVLVIALEDVAESLVVAEHCKRHFPHLTVLARARNRRHAHLLMDRRVTRVVRETFYSSLRLTEQVMREMGVSDGEAHRTMALFEERDERMLVDTHDYYDDEKQLIQTNRQITEELRSILEADRDPVDSALPEPGEPGPRPNI